MIEGRRLELRRRFRFPISGKDGIDESINNKFGDEGFYKVNSFVLRRNSFTTNTHTHTIHNT